MSRPEEKLKEHYTYADYLKWDDDVYYELIDGVPDPLPTPLRDHQILLGGLFHQFADFLDDKHQDVFGLLSAVRLNASGLDDDVFLPDLFVISDRSKYDENSYNGSPDLIIEILGNNTAHKDRYIKYHKYLKAKVLEYWIVDPYVRSVETFILNDNKYKFHIYDAEEKVAVSVIDGLIIDMKLVFDKIKLYNIEGKNVNTS